jgi:hypothetical protein
LTPVNQNNVIISTNKPKVTPRISRGAIQVSL